MPTFNGCQRVPLKTTFFAVNPPCEGADAQAHTEYRVGAEAIQNWCAAVTAVPSTCHYGRKLRGRAASVIHRKSLRRLRLRLMLEIRVAWHDICIR